MAMAMATSSTYNKQSNVYHWFFFSYFDCYSSFDFQKIKYFFVSLNMCVATCQHMGLALIILKEKMLQVLLFWLPNKKKGLDTLYYKSLSSSLIRGSVHFQLKKEITYYLLYIY